MAKHWTQTAEGGRRMSEIQRKAWTTRRQKATGRAVKDAVTALQRDPDTHAALTLDAIKRTAVEKVVPPVNGVPQEAESDFPRIEAHTLQQLALYGARMKLQQLEQERVALEQFIKRGGKW